MDILFYLHRNIKNWLRRTVSLRPDCLTSGSIETLETSGEEFPYLCLFPFLKNEMELPTVQSC